MRTVSKKVLSLLLVTVLVLSAIPFAAFADNTCPVDGCNGTLEPVNAVPATCTTEGTKAHYKCSENDTHLYQDAAGATPATAEWLKIASGHHLVRHAAVAADCKTGTAGTEAYDKCEIVSPCTQHTNCPRIADTVCGAMFAVDSQGNTGNAIAAPVSVPASHTDANNDGVCDVPECGASIKCTITFKIVRVNQGQSIENATDVLLASNSISIKQGEKMGNPVVAPECPRGYAYDRLNGSVWTMVEKNGSPVTNGGSYSKDNVVTVDMESVVYRAVQREQTVNLTVAFRKGNTEYTYCTIPNIPYSETLENGNSISVYRYMLTHDMDKNTSSDNSIMKSFENAFASKSIPTNNGTGALVDVTGFTWTNDQKFLSAATNNPINNDALKLNINLGIANPDVKVYANLKEKTSFEITFSPMSPYDSTASVQGNFGKKTVTLNSVLSGLPTPTCTGYVFMGWYDEPMKGPMTYNNGIVTLDGQNAGAKHYVNGTQYTTRGNITLYPYWIKEVDAWVVVHNSKDATVSSMAKIQGVKPTDSIAKTTVLANVQGYTANNFIGPIKSDSATGFNNWTAAPMGASVATNATDSIYFHIYSPSARAVSVTPGANSGANGSYSGGSSSSAAADPSNPKTGDAQRTELNAAAIVLAVATVALTVMTSVMFIRRKYEI